MKSILISMLPLVALGCGRSGIPDALQASPEALPASADPFQVADCPECVLRCTTMGEADWAGRVYLRSEGEGAVSGRVVRGPLHEETRAGAATGAPVVLAEGKAVGDLERGRFTGDASMITAARVAIDGAEISVGITYSWIELAGTLSVDGQTHPLVCWEPAALARKVIYDGAAGGCSAGVGMGTPFTVAFVRETKNGECGIPMHADLHEDATPGAVLRGWNLKGARLGTGLHSADLLEADLRGADLTYLDARDARLTGQVDAFTRLPAQGCTLTGERVTCVW